MDTIEKIQDKVEQLRRKELPFLSDYENGCIVGYNEALDNILCFIGSFPDEPVTNGLEEAAEEYQTEARKHVLDNTPIGTAKDAFIAGAKWQKKQMLKDAVEGKVFMSFAPGHNQMVMADVDLPTNTKVKLIIVKED